MAQWVTQLCFILVSILFLRKKLVFNYINALLVSLCYPIVRMKTCLCNKEITQKFKRHMEVHSKTRYSCSECNKSFTRKDQLKVHINSVHKGQKFMCDICTKIYDSQPSLKYHISSIHEQKRYNCELCDESFSYSATLKSHVKRVHALIKPEYKCDHCDYRAKHTGHLNVHIKSVHNKERFQCAKCPKNFISAQALRNHITLSHKKNEETLIDITLCDA